MKPLRAFILDLDGVITDTAEYHYRSWKRLADEEGIPFARADNEHLRGVSRRRSLELLLGDRLDDYSEAQVQEMMARKNGYYQAFLKQITAEDFLPGARELIEEIKRRGFKVAIGSASKNTHTVLSQLQIEAAFDVVADGHSVERAKPAPDLFLYAAERMAVLPQACVVIEDAAAGVQAALTAGMMTVGIGPQERVGTAHLCYETTADIDLDQIITFWHE